MYDAEHNKVTKSLPNRKFNLKLNKHE